MAGKVVEPDAGFGTGGSAAGGAGGDAGVGEEALWILDPEHIPL